MSIIHRGYANTAGGTGYMKTRRHGQGSPDLPIHDSSEANGFRKNNMFYTEHTVQGREEKEVNTLINH